MLKRNVFIKIKKVKEINHKVLKEEIISLELLRIVGEKVKNAGYLVCNIDVTMIAQKPKLKDHIPQMVQNIAAALHITAGQVNVKATTEEHLGFTGDGSGMSCHAVCLLEEI